VKVNKRNIEFQLGGGGFGTAGDDTSTSVPVVTADKTRREKDLEQEVKRETDPARKKKQQEELDDLRKERSRENTRLEAAVAQAEAIKQDSVRQRAAAGGSRFNLVFPAGVPAGALTPQYVMAALKTWVEFDAAGPAGSAPAAILRKGLSEAELQRLFGDPVKREPGASSDFHVEVLTFRKNGATLEATMVEGVLVRFKQWSD
jgi:hypothetical protein